MLRRLEMYRLRPDATPEARAGLLRALRDCPRYIPEVLDSAIGWNRSGAAIDLVWEQAYADPDAYTRYMRHPFHICVLDHYLLPDNPSTILGASDLGLGLLGYAIPTPEYRATQGVRRVVGLRVDPRADPQRVAALDRALRSLPIATRGPQLSVVGANHMGLEWFPEAWTHVWEQVFPDQAALDEFLAQPSPLAAWPEVIRSVAVHYRIDARSSAEAEAA
jgi:hypothetical protein